MPTISKFFKYYKKKVTSAMKVKLKTRHTMGTNVIKMTKATKVANETKAMIPFKVTNISKVVADVETKPLK